MAKPERLISLPFSKSIEISFKSLRVRFFRSMITVSSLVLAVSFLSFVLVNLDIAAGMLAHGGKEAARALSQAGYDVDLAQGVVAMSAKERWIVLLSLLVCTVGIVNAQLMSVTERFREIGIMKCLGALDRIVLRLFLLEALIVGLVGSGAGALLGLTAAFGSSLVHYSALDYSGMSLLPLLAEAGKAWGTGVVLSLLGVLYPAILAAKLQPIIVMREEH